MPPLPEADLQVISSLDETPSKGQSTDELSSSFSSAASISSQEDAQVTPSTTRSNGSRSSLVSLPSYSEWWTSRIKALHRPILDVLISTAKRSATFPIATLSVTIALSLALMGTGLLTNFAVEVNENVLWTPRNSLPVQHYHWIQDESGFPNDTRYLTLFVHGKGSNVLNTETFEYAFDVLDSLRALPQYETMCAEASYYDSSTNSFTCQILSPTGHWYHNVTEFRQSVQTDDDLKATLSRLYFPTNVPFPADRLLGNIVYQENNNPNDYRKVVESAQGLYVIIWPPDTELAKEWETKAVEVVLSRNTDDDNDIVVEVLAESTFPTEFERAIAQDIPLIPLVFIMMGSFVSLVFWKHNDKVASRALTGFGAVVAVLLSIVSGFGILFIVGVPFTSITQLLPFLMFGIGLDDSFILFGSYIRTDPDKDVVMRIEETIQDVGLSITLTTLTSATAFALGTMSSIPAVFWLCLYSCPTILLVFVYQLTFFVAVIALDERRIAANRRDICICIVVPKSEEEDYNDDEVHTDDAGSQRAVNAPTADTKSHLVDRIMEWYARKLLLPWVKVFVLAAFTALLIGASFSATKLTQEFKVTDILPRDSYATDFLESTELYTNSDVIDVRVYFRDVDQQDPKVQQQMKDFMKDLANGTHPVSEAMDKGETFWLENFNVFVIFNGLVNASFPEQLDRFLENPLFRELHHDELARDEDGNLVASRARVRMTIDVEDVERQIFLIEGQREVSFSQSVNNDKERLSFFTYDPIYNIWEFYVRSISELRTATIVGIAAVTLVSFIFIPHWTAVLFIFPLICVLYIDLLGVMQWGGVHINAMSYVSLTMSIGLLVDFIMHILFRFYEVSGNREEKTVEMLRTMGSSILCGGLTTFLGTLPLIFTSSEVFNIVFISFLGIVTLGIGHGLILLPVLLSLLGPEVQVSMASDLVETKMTETKKLKTPKTPMKDFFDDDDDDKNDGAEIVC